jgi:hypothetical protein
MSALLLTPRRLLDGFGGGGPGHHHAQDHGLVHHRLGGPAVGRHGVAGEPGQRGVWPGDGDDCGPPGRRRPPLRPPQGRVFSSGFEGILIIARRWALCGRLASRLFDPQPLEQLGWGLALSVASSAQRSAGLGDVCARRAHRSIALEADARHLVTDVWTSAGVVVGLRWCRFTGWLWLDPVVAIGRGAQHPERGRAPDLALVAGLMDEAVEPEVLATIHATLAGFASTSVARARSSALTTCTPARPVSAALWTCTCTCRRNGRWGARPPCAPAWNRPDERRARLARHHPAAAQHVEAHFDDERDLK